LFFHAVSLKAVLLVHEYEVIGTIQRPFDHGRETRSLFGSGGRDLVVEFVNYLDGVISGEVFDYFELSLNTGFRLLFRGDSCVCSGLSQ
jgi:hypothetical protein